MRTMLVDYEQVQEDFARKDKEIAMLKKLLGDVSDYFDGNYSDSDFDHDGGLAEIAAKVFVAKGIGANICKGKNCKSIGQANHSNECIQAHSDTVNRGSSKRDDA